MGPLRGRGKGREGKEGGGEGVEREIGVLGRKRWVEGKGREKEGKEKGEKNGGEGGKIASLALGDRRPYVNEPYFLLG